MKKTVIVLLVLLLALCCCGCGVKLEESSYGADIAAGSVRLEAEYPVYGADMDRLTFFIYNDGETELSYGEPYQLEVQQNGKWYVIPFPADYAWNDMAYTLPAGGAAAVTVRLSGLDYDFKDGSYRLVKEVAGQPVAALFQLGKSAITAATPYGFASLRELGGDYTAEQAAADGCLVLAPGAVENAGQLDGFLHKVELRAAAMLRIADYRGATPSLTDVVYQGSGGGFRLRTATAETIWAYLISDGSGIYLSNGVDWASATRLGLENYPLLLGADLSEADSVRLAAWVERLSAAQVAANTSVYRVYAPNGSSFVSVEQGGLSWNCHSESGGFSDSMEDPQSTVTGITQVEWADDTVFVLRCATTAGQDFYYAFDLDGVRLSAGYASGWQWNNGTLELLD